jgi:hypothetical protein
LRLLFTPGLLALLAVLPSAGPARAWEQELDVRQLRTLPEESHDPDYYALRRDPRGLYVHATYLPGYRAIRRGFEVPEAHKIGHLRLSWRWRALALPTGGDECDSDHRDSAGSVYVLWRRGFRTYGLKYSWSAVGKLGAICDRWNNPIIRGETIIQRSGGPLRVWVDESLDIDAEFHKHFGADAEVPPLLGVAILTDGDQTHSLASCDFGSFILSGT